MSRSVKICEPFLILHPPSSADLLRLPPVRLRSRAHNDGTQWTHKHKNERLSHEVINPKPTITLSPSFNSEDLLDHNRWFKSNRTRSYG